MATLPSTRGIEDADWLQKPQSEKHSSDPINQLAFAEYPPERRAEVESEVVLKVLQDNRAELKMSAGLPENALPYHREMHAIARDVLDLQAQYRANMDRLAAVARYDIEVDPVSRRSTPPPAAAQAQAPYAQGAPPRAAGLRSCGGRSACRAFGLRSPGSSHAC